MSVYIYIVNKTMKLKRVGGPCQLLPVNVLAHVYVIDIGYVCIYIYIFELG